MIKKTSISLSSVLALAILSVGVAYAHEVRDVGDYQLVVGFMVEPAVEGVKNGVDVRVRDAESQEPIEGMEESLQVEVTCVPTDTSETYSLRTLFRDPGHYTADLIPTAPGHYRMRVFGDLDGAPVDETFESRSVGGNFGDVLSSVDLQFPEQLPQVREIEGAVRGAQSAAEEAQNVALGVNGDLSSARAMAIIGIVLGAVGVLSAAGSGMVALRRR